MEIISNTAIIAVNQDPLGCPAIRIWKNPQEAGGDLQLWAGPLADGSVPLHSLFPRALSYFLFHSQSSTVVVLLNTSPERRTIDLLLSDVFVNNVCDLQLSERSSSFMLTPDQHLAAKETYHLHDLWVKDPSSGSWGKWIGTTAAGIMQSITVESHLTRVFKVVRINKAEGRLETRTDSIRKVHVNEL